MNDERNERGELLRRMGPFLSLGMTFGAAVLLGVGAGYWADKRFGTDPWLTLAGLLIGIALGCYNFFCVVLRNPPG